MEWEEKTPSWDVAETAPNLGGYFADVMEVHADDVIVNVMVTSTPNMMSIVDTTCNEGGVVERTDRYGHDVEDNHQTIN